MSLKLDASPGGYTISVADPLRDHHAILRLWAKNLPGASATRYSWLYNAGPASGLMLHAPDGQVVGATGLMRRTFQCFGDMLDAGQAIDLNVDRDHRSIGPALMLGRAVVDSVTRGELRLVYGFPNRQSEGVLRRIGYRTIGDLGRWVRPLSCRAVLRRRGWCSFLSCIVSSITDPFLWLTSPERSCGTPSDLRVDLADGFDSRFDQLWEKVASKSPILGERTADYLRWRFARHGEIRYRVLCLSNSAGELLAYLVYSCRDYTAYVADFLFAQPEHFDCLMAEFLRMMRHQGVEAVVVVYLGKREVCETLGKFGFWQRPGHWKAMVYAEPQTTNGLLDRLLDAENWYFTRADIDTDE